MCLSVLKPSKLLLLLLLISMNTQIPSLIDILHSLNNTKFLRKTCQFVEALQLKPSKPIVFDSYGVSSVLGLHILFNSWECSEIIQSFSSNCYYTQISIILHSEYFLLLCKYALYLHTEHINNGINVYIIYILIIVHIVS